MRKKEELAVGSRVKVNDLWTDTVLEGKVQSLLSVQFTVVTDKGSTFFVPYDGAWEILSGD